MLGADSQIERQNLNTTRSSDVGEILAMPRQLQPTRGLHPTQVFTLMQPTMRKHKVSV